MLSAKTVLSSALLVGAASAQAICATPNATGLMNTDSNVAFAQGYYGVPDPTQPTFGQLSGLPWAYPIGHCGIVVASGDAPYWKHVCMDDGDYVMAYNYGTDSTCTSDPIGNATLMANGSLAYNCGTGTSDSYLVAQMYVASCSETDASLKNTYTAVGQGMCALTLLPKAEGDDNDYPGYGNFYCDKEGIAVSLYEYGDGTPCAGDVCFVNTIDFGECSLLTQTVSEGQTIEVYSRPLTCMSAQKDTCRDGTTDSCEEDDGSASAAMAALAMAASAVAAMLL